MEKVKADIQPPSVVLERDGVGGFGVLLAVATAISDFEPLGSSGRDEGDSPAAIGTSLEFRRTGQKMSEADLVGARRAGACVSTTESLELFVDKEGSGYVGIGGSGASSGSFVIFVVPQIDNSETGRSKTSDATASDASLFRKVHQEPALCNLTVSVAVLSMPPCELVSDNNHS